MKAMRTVFSVAGGTQLYVRLRVWQAQSAKPATAHIQLFRWLDRTCYAIGVANDIANQGDVQILKAGMRGHHCRVRIYPARPLHPGFHKKVLSSMQKKAPRINRFSQMVRFIRVSRLLLWTIWVIYRERRRVIRARERGNYEVQPNIDVLIQVLVAFRVTAIKLGVLMIKLGQF